LKITVFPGSVRDSDYSLAVLSSCLVTSVNSNVERTEKIQNQDALYSVRFEAGRLFSPVYGTE